MGCGVCFSDGVGGVFLADESITVQVESERPMIPKRNGCGRAHEFDIEPLPSVGATILACKEDDLRRQGDGAYLARESNVKGTSTGCHFSSLPTQMLAAVKITQSAQISKSETSFLTASPKPSSTKPP